MFLRYRYARWIHFLQTSQTNLTSQKIQSAQFPQTTHLSRYIHFVRLFRSRHWIQNDHFPQIIQTCHYDRWIQKIRWYHSVQNSQKIPLDLTIRSSR